MTKRISNDELIYQLNIENLKLTPQSMKLSINLLNNILLFIFKESTLRTHRTIKAIRKLMSIINTDETDDVEYTARVNLIKRSTAYAADDRIDSVNMLKDVLRNDSNFTELEERILTEMEKETITYNDSKKLLDLISDRLNYGYSIQITKVIGELLQKIDMNDYRSCKAIESKLIKVAKTIVAYYNQNTLSNEDIFFSLQTDYFDTATEYAYKKLSKSTIRLLTGMRYFNILTAPGVESGRLYIFCATPGGGKSQLLLNLAIQYRRYNTSVNQAFPDKVGAIVYISLENKFDESFERLYHIAGMQGNILDYSLPEVKKQLREKGKLRITPDNPLDLIMIRKRRNDQKVDDFRTLYFNMLDNGIEPVCLIIDYLKLIKPSRYGMDERVQLREITDDLKDLSEELNIPIITAQQINRFGTDIITTSSEANNYDLALKMRSSFIADSWNVFENADFLCMIIRERQQISNRLFMGFQAAKKRYQGSIETEEEEGLRNLSYFAQPYVDGNEIELEEDMSLPYALGVTSLKPSVEDIKDTIKSKGKKKGKRMENMEENEVAFSPQEYFSQFDFPVD